MTVMPSEKDIPAFAFLCSVGYKYCLKGVRPHNTNWFLSLYHTYFSGEILGLLLRYAYILTQSDNLSDRQGESVVVLLIEPHSSTCECLKGLWKFCGVLKAGGYFMLTECLIFSCHVIFWSQMANKNLWSFNRSPAVTESLFTAGCRWKVDREPKQPSLFKTIQEFQDNGKKTVWSPWMCVNVHFTRGSLSVHESMSSSSSAS